MTEPVISLPPRVLPGLLAVATVVAFVAGLLGTVLSGDVANWFGGVAVAVIIAAPLLRVAILGVCWARNGDRRYAAVAGALLLLTAVGAGLAFL